MYAIIDKRASSEIKRNLKNYVDGIFEFSSEDITYNSISGHPDIFLFQNKNELIIAPNSPKELLSFLNKKKVNYTLGNKPVGECLDKSVLYNCIATEKYFFSKKDKSDLSIQKSCFGKQFIQLPQAYTRCSMFVLDDKVITSDKGIVKVLKQNNLDYFYFDPSEIKIEDHKNGFVGGTMGVLDDKVFFLGNILKHKDGKLLHQYIKKQGKEIICLEDDYLYDGGGIFFVK